MKHSDIAIGDDEPAVKLIETGLFTGLQPAQATLVDSGKTSDVHEDGDILQLHMVDDTSEVLGP